MQHHSFENLIQPPILLSKMVAAFEVLCIFNIYVKIPV